MQILVLLICLFHSLTAYNLYYILMSAELNIGKKYYSQDNKNWTHWKWLTIYFTLQKIIQSQHFIIDIRSLILKKLTLSEQK
jgi:hypothetical protein